MKRGDRLGRWTLRNVIGEGGNAHVWDASDADGGLVAIKVLKSANVAGESWTRFRDEVAVLQRLAERRGVVPLLDSSLPEAPTGSDPAWLAMPLAMPIREAASEWEEAAR